MYDNFIISVNLSKLNGTKVKELKTKDGETVECVIIPVKQNNIFVSEKSGAYLNLSARENKDQRYSTHSLVVNVNKEEYLKMSKADKDKIPTCGTMSPIGFKQNIKRNKKEETSNKNSKFSINNMPF